MIDFNKVFKKTESTTDINILIHNAIKRRQTLSFKKIKAEILYVFSIVDECVYRIYEYEEK